ncbi:uncharacterized protein NEMAJ01_0357 [Nematocida major]|uniref:uncharacterized protein n=1 Tax=Nematocida major TaxID=1912982 RepID=UPI002007FA87|nr:uncharacterized protein NEMAJ01_0357 [Nematocida major]KAH9385461.1 hypothetical protein NEMAJ01_0357 [Nematocida major]
MGLYIVAILEKLTKDATFTNIINAAILPVCIVVEMFILPAYLYFLAFFKGFKNVFILRSVWIGTSKAYKNPTDSLSDMADLTSEIFGIFLTFLPKSMFEFGKGLQTRIFGKKTPPSIEKAAKKTYKRKTTKAPLFSFFEHLIGALRTVYNQTCKHLVGWGIVIAKYILMAALVLLGASAIIVLYALNNMAIFLHQILSSVPFLSTFAFLFPAQASPKVGDLINSMANAITPSGWNRNAAGQPQQAAPGRGRLYNDAEKIHEKVQHGYTTYVTPANKVAQSYLKICVLVISSSIAIFFRVFAELGKSFASSGGYTTFWAGIAGCIALAGVFFSSQIVDPLDYSMQAHSKMLNNISEINLMLVPLFAFFFSFVAIAYNLYTSLTDKENQRNRESASDLERDNFVFVALNLLIAVLALTGAGAILNILAGGPNNIFETAPMSMIYITLIGIVYDIKNMLYGARTNQTKQYKSILIIMLIVLSFYANTTQIKALHYASLFATLGMLLLPAKNDKNAHYIPYGERARAQQAIYLIIRILLVSAIVTVLGPHLGTVLLRPFLYVKIALKALHAILIMQAKYVLL